MKNSKRVLKLDKFTVAKIQDLRHIIGGGDQWLFRSDGATHLGQMVPLREMLQL